MSEPDCISRAAIPEQLMLSRLAQSEQMREFFIQMWIQNPALDRQGGIKVQSLLSPLEIANAEEIGSAPNSPAVHLTVRGELVEPPATYPEHFGKLMVSGDFLK